VDVSVDGQMLTLSWDPTTTRLYDFVREFCVTRVTQRIDHAVVCMKQLADQLRGRL
jgi:hypothetical protein